MTAYDEYSTKENLDISDILQCDGANSVVSSSSRSSPNKTAEQHDHVEVEHDDHEQMEQDDHDQVEQDKHKQVEHDDHEQVDQDKNKQVEHDDHEQVDQDEHKQVENDDNEQMKHDNNEQGEQDDHHQVEQGKHKQVEHDDHKQGDQDDHEQVEHGNHEHMEHGNHEQVEHEHEEPDHNEQKQKGNSIPVRIGKIRPFYSRRRDASTALKRISTNPRIEASSTMSVVAVANVRSLLPKLNAFIEKIENEEIEVALVVEVWEKMGEKNNHFQSKVEEIMQMKGLKYISCGARLTGKRGGGAAILVNTVKFAMEKLEVNVPNNLEVQWGLVRPKKIWPNTKYCEMIFCSFYSPPASRKHRRLLDHLVSATHALMARFPQAAVYIGGDKNQLALAPLLLALPRFKQVVTNSTHGDKIIDVLIMSCPELYAVPEVIPPVLPDNPWQASPSDHWMPVARPIAFASDPVCSTYLERSYRPLPDSRFRDFMKWIHEETWDSVPETGSPTEVVEEYERLVHGKVEELFSERKVRITNRDKPFITAEIKTLDRKRMREWRKHGKTTKYLDIKKEFLVKYKKAASDYLKKCVSDLKREQPGKSAATLKRMGAQPGDCGEGGLFTLINHLKENLSVEEQNRKFSDFFMAVSQEFPPLHVSQLSDKSRLKLAQICQETPIVQDREIF